MPYWLAIAVVMVAALAVVARILHGAVRKRCPYLVGRTSASAALARLAATRRGTEVDIVERELGQGPAWERLLKSWLKKGAAIRCLVHVRSERGESALRGLAAKAAGGSLRLFAVRDAERRSDLIRDSEGFHFWIFRDPDQLWLEGRHSAGDGCARDCEYVPRASSDERWRARREDFAALVEQSEEIALG